MTWIIFSFSAYLAGAVPFGTIIARKVAGLDITQKGSGNIGATNVAREIGLKWGLLTLILDLFKGFLPVFLFALLMPNHHIGLSMVALSALLGHQFSIFKTFKGGKGVATALGIYLALAPLASLMAIPFFILTVAVSDFVSLGSMVCAAMMPILLVLSGGDSYLVAASVVIAVLICLKHTDNIQRLFRGEERHWRKKAVRSKHPANGQARHRNRNE